MTNTNDSTLDRAITDAQNEVSSLAGRLAEIFTERDGIKATLADVEAACENADSALADALARCELNQATDEDVKAAQEVMSAAEGDMKAAEDHRRRLKVLNAMEQHLEAQRNDAHGRLEALRQQRHAAMIASVVRRAEKANAEYIRLTEEIEDVAIEAMACAAVLTDHKASLQGCQEVRRYFGETMRANRPQRVFQQKHRIAEDLGFGN